ncbi:MAG: hypothetical protein H0U44_06490 [Flavisolibacter sp.]|nr:hypothetical protein [Flavisolibacter sp.]
MKKFFNPTASFLVLLPLVMFLQGCLKDTCINTYKIYTPIYKTLTEVRAEMGSQAPREIKQAGKIFLYGSYLFMNEPNKGIHVINNANPAVPIKIGFINIPGNVDLAVKGNYLFADSYSDIVVFDISNPNAVHPVKFMDNVIKEHGMFWANHTVADSVQVIVGYNERDTTVDCSTYSRWQNCANCSFQDALGNSFSIASGAAAPSGGRGGSMARFAQTGNFLYGVSETSLYSIDITNPQQPVQTAIKNVGWGIETIYPFQDKLFIGSNTGMFIFNISNPSNPTAMGEFTHARSCDPVITDGQYAYVTLRSGNACFGTSNQMDVIDITNLNNPSLVKTYPFTNPHGLDKDGNTLFICDGAAGLRVIDASNVQQLVPIRQISGLNTYDIIAHNGIAIVVASDGLYQFDYSNTSNIYQVSKINIKN